MAICPVATSGAAPAQAAAQSHAVRPVSVPVTAS